jgi:hypothetical protein
MLGLEGTTSLNHVISSGSCLYEINLANCALDIAGTFSSCVLSHVFILLK